MWRSYNPQQVLETYKGAVVVRISPSSKHWWDSDSKLAETMDAVIHDWLNQARRQNGSSLKVGGIEPPQRVLIDCVVSFRVDQRSYVDSS